MAQTILFEDIRCFHGFHECPIKPITLLTGENSSGKTTFLALARIAWDIAAGDLREDVFNEEPFLLGSYDQIASFRGGRAGRAESFLVGVQFPVRLNGKRSDLLGNEATITARFRSQAAQSRLDEWTFRCGSLEVIAKQSTLPTRLDISIKTPKGSQPVMKGLPFPGWIGTNRILSELGFLLLRESRGSKPGADRQKPLISEPDVEVLRGLLFQAPRALGQRPYAIAPIRTQPKRTYDPLKEVPKPEGSHVPLVLARTLTEDSEGGKRLKDALVSFGVASGLYTDIDIKRKGPKESDPFQIGIKVAGPTFNLVDVGYGVSQVLPIIVDTVEQPKGSCFLLQQPEVHLHPKAQAELGSFLGTLAKEQSKRFVIETHSDHLTDRIRMDVRDKKQLTPQDVSILYFERCQTGVKIHTLAIDEFGNIVNAPPTYRQFFLEEERRLLGV